MNTLRKIVLHVGSDKTGSTAIQNLLDLNRDLLAEHGYCYPPGQHHALFAAHFSEEPLNLDHFRARTSAYAKVDIKASAEDYIKGLTSDLSKNNYHTLILSYEGFLGLNSTGFGSLKSFLNQFSDNIQVVYYLRPHLSYAISAMSERVRFGRPAWCQHPPITLYMPRLKLLSDVFARQSLCLKCFTKDNLLQGDIIIDFLAQIEMPRDLVSRLERASGITNRSLSEAAILIGDAMARLLVPVSGPKDQEFRDLFCELLEQIDGRRYQLTSPQVDMIKHATKRDTELVLNQYGINLGITDGSSNVKLALSEEIACSRARILIAQVLPEIVLPDVALKGNRLYLKKRPAVAQVLLEKCCRRLSCQI